MSQALTGFEQAAAALKDIGNLGSMYDAVAGAARCQLKRQDLPAAGELAVSLWAYLKQHSGRRMEFPVLGYETCADVFTAAGEARLARRAMGAGYGELLVRAGKISLPEWRRSFLEQVPEHCRVSERWQAYLQEA